MSQEEQWCVSGADGWLWDSWNRLITRYICNLHLIEHRQGKPVKVNGVRAPTMPGHLFCCFTDPPRWDFINKINAARPQPEFLPSFLSSPCPIFLVTMKERKHDLNGAAAIWEIHSPPDLACWRPEVKHYKWVCLHAPLWVMRTWLNSSIQSIQWDPTSPAATSFTCFFSGAWWQD